MANLHIIPNEIDPSTTQGRNELRKFLKKQLSGYDKAALKIFALRVAMRTAWRLQRLAVKDEKSLDRFYYYWIRAIVAASTVVFFEKNKVTGLGVDAADAAYAAIITELDQDLLTLSRKNSLINQPLWHTTSDKPPSLNLQGLADFWQLKLFAPAVEGCLFNQENLLFFKGFLSIGDKVFEQKSAEALRISIQEFIDKNGQVATTRLARLILLGNGGAGKTSLVNKLCNPRKALAVNESPTPRIVVRDHIVTDKAGNETVLHVWDFGGQVIMHSTHSFFLSDKSTYIIACNARANEQPDAWLRMLQSRLSSSQKITVLVVYTHCDQNQLKKNNVTAWRRDHALRRAFADLDLDFYNIDLIPNQKEVPGFSALKTTIDLRAIEEGKERVDSDIVAIRDVSKALEYEQTPYITQGDLVEKLAKLAGTTLRDDVDQAFRLANSYGYIFPQSPLSVDEKPCEADFIWVSQKHWLTFGVYSLINNPEVIANSGLLTEKHINTALCIDEPQRITKQGEVVSGRKTKTMEGIMYDEAGIQVLKTILLNYRWALIHHKRLDQLLLPLSTPLDEPADLAEWVVAFDRAESRAMDDKPLEFEVVLSNQPADLFFKLATYLDSHLPKPEYLWRRGAMLGFYSNEETRAILEMTDNVLTIRVMGEQKESFQQLLLINVRETLNSYKNKSFGVHLYERIWLDDKKSQMVNSELIASLTLNGTTFVDKLVEQKLKGAVTMTTFNIAGDAKGNFGDGKHQYAEGDIHNVHITQVNEQGTALVTQLKMLRNAVPESNQDAINKINQSITQIENGIAEKDNEKKKSLMRKGLDGVKDLVVMDKGVDLVAEYAPAVASGLTALSDLLG